jgi:hypothetical protein
MLFTLSFFFYLNIKLAPLLNLCGQIAVGDGIGGDISRILTVWMEETQVSRLNSHVNSVEERCTRSIIKECMGTNTVFRISSKLKRTVRANFPDGFSYHDLCSSSQ